MNIDERSVKTGNGTFELPPKEFDVLMFLAENQGKILTKQRIYEAVWKEPYVYDDNNIMAVISRLRKNAGRKSGKSQIYSDDQGNRLPV